MSPSDATRRSRARVLNVLLWSAQIVLALTFAFAGVSKLVLSLAELTVMVPAAPSWLVRWIGLAEAAGAIGILFPVGTRLGRTITVAAAIGLFSDMVLAVAAHLGRSETPQASVPATLAVLCAFVAWGRGMPADTRAR